MRQSQLFIKTRREVPADETAQNAQFLIRGGFVFKEMAGVYSLLPLGLRVIKKIEKIIREEMNAIGGIEMKTSVLQSKEVWMKSNRWDDSLVDNWFKTKFKNGTEVGLSFTNEEAYSNILKQYINSYKDLPAYPYDFKEIFRNEARSKSGLLRGREFFWKALYSFSKNESEHLSFYNQASEAYKKIFNRVGIAKQTYLTFASGGTFSRYSHEFQTICEAGEDIIYLDEEKKLAVNKEVYNDQVLKDLNLEKENLKEAKAIEVGNIFTLGTRFSEPFDFKYKNEKGEESLVFMGSYGIGLGRLMGTIVEVLSDEKGIVWPEEVAPFEIHLVSLAKTSTEKEQAEKLYKKLLASGKEVLFDDREEVTPGQKFADSDLIGVPYRYIISAKTLEKESVEVIDRKSGETNLVLLNKI